MMLLALSFLQQQFFCVVHAGMCSAAVCLSPGWLRIYFYCNSARQQPPTLMLPCILQPVFYITQNTGTETAAAAPPLN